MSIEQMVEKIKTDRNYVPPINARKLGRLAFERGRPVDFCVTDEMRRGWLQALRAAAWAEGSEYLVGQGAEVSI